MLALKKGDVIAVIREEGKQRRRGVRRGGVRRERLRESARAAHNTRRLNISKLIYMSIPSTERASSAATALQRAAHAGETAGSRENG